LLAQRASELGQAMRTLGDDYALVDVISGIAADAK
jgi:hypothetical protein